MARTLRDGRRTPSSGRAALFAWDDDLDTPEGRRVTQCALSRICGGCGRPLGRPVAFVGTDLEVGRNAFPAPPLHLDCARDLLVRRADWRLVTTAGFEFVRPAREDADRRPTFQPNSRLS